MDVRLSSEGGASRDGVKLPIEDRALVVIVMGVAGSGKTTVGQLLALSIGWEFHDADDLHPPANREKMARGVALTDDDRRPWLEAVRGLIEHCIDGGTAAVIACSALKQAYRNLIIVNPADVRVVYLRGERSLIEKRLASRRGHFFDRRLLESQFEALEEPVGAIIEDVSRDPQVIVESIRAKIGI